MKSDIIICKCNSTEHQIVFFYDDEDKLCYMHVHLNKRPFYERFLHGIKYILGYQSRFGQFDEFIFNEDDAEKLQTLVNFLKK